MHLLSISGPLRWALANQRTCVLRHGFDAACGEARSLHSVHDEEKPFEMELAWICDASGREFKRVPAELSVAAERQAKAALADSDMCALSSHGGCYCWSAPSAVLGTFEWRSAQSLQLL